MTSLSKKLLALLFGATISISHIGYCSDKPLVGDVATFKAAQTYGLIGITEESPVDNPADNIFHVKIDESLCGDEKLWLVYDLEGVADHTSISRSINDQRAVGGYLIKKRRGWAEQREQISSSWLKTGDNIVRFTLPAGAEHSYRIRNLRIEMEKSNSDEALFQLQVNQPSKTHYQNHAYVKGLLSGAESTQVKLKIEGRDVAVLNGEFESLIDLSSANNSCTIEIEATHPDGSTTCHPVEFSESASLDYVFLRTTTYQRNEEFFDASKAQSVSLEGAVLEAGAGSLPAAAHLSITTLRDVDIPALDAGMVNVTKNHDGFRFLPNGTSFLEEAKLTVSFDVAKIPDGYTEKDIKTYYFDEQTHHWIAVPTDTVLLEEGKVVSKTSHFTDYINAIIKVPESPEVEAYNSTSMKGIKAANPTAAVNLINPPQANNTGSASLGYPINIPAGRNGMQPQLGINYNSGGGNGWLGLGWNMTLPMISIDTRWGVPRYDPAKETETYSMNGEMLAPVAHRGELQNRTSEKQFYPRVEGGFNNIIRHGDGPSNYWWEVTDKSGTKYLYGASGITGSFDEDAVLRTEEQSTTEDKGDIAQWCLSEVRDLNGNFVKYHYAKVQDTGLEGGTVPGFQIYIDKITYTGFGSAEGLYAVEFEREGGRQDVTISGNLGFKMVTAHLLKRVLVKFGTEDIRSYELNYKTGEFYKTLLASISEFDAKGELFNTHEFEYHNDVRNDGQFQPLQKTGDAWSVPNDGVKENFVISNSDFSDKASALSGNRSTDWGAGLSISVALGLQNLACKTLSIGGNYSYSQSASEGLLSMVDINGDGLSDKIFLKDDGVKYRTNLGYGNFSEGAPFGITGISDLYREKSKSNNAGFEANIGQCKSIGIVVNKGWNWTTSTTSAYFADVNGDQLIDFVKDGRVRFNTIDPVTGQITFVENSSSTPSPIVVGAGATDIVTQTEEERQEAEAQHPLHDVVKMWRAPFDGRVDITAPVKLIQSNDPERAESPADGVRVSVQFKETPLWFDIIAGDDYAIHQPSGLTGLEVRTGDRIYFRVGSRDNGSFDQVNWSPIIEYKSDTTDLSKIKDSNGNGVYRFDAERDFILTSSQTIVAPLNGTVTITGSFIKPQTTDEVHLVVLRNPRTSADTIMQRKLAWNETANGQFEKTNISVQEDDELTFHAISSTTIDWARVQWKPRMIYTSTTNTSVNLDVAPIESFPVPEYSVLANTLQPSKSWNVKFTSDTLKTDSIKVAPLLKVISSFPSFPFPAVEDDIIFSIKKRDTLLAKRKLHLVNGRIAGSDSTLSVIVNKDDSIFIEYHVPTLRMASSMGFEAQVSGEYIKTDTVASGLYSVMPAGNKYEDIIFGPLYRGWGHFAWRGSGVAAEAIIDEDQLKLSDALTDPDEPGNIGNPDDFDNSNAYDPAEDQFIMLTALGREQWWGGSDNLTYVASSVISSSRLGDDDLSAPSYNGGTGASAVNKISKSKGGSFSLGLSGGSQSFGASGNYSWSDGNNTVIIDYMDMNGDRYPDVVAKDKIQYTSARGGLEPEAVPHAQPDIQNSVTHTEGVTVAGSALGAKAEPSSFNIKNVKVSVGSGQNSAGLNGNYAWGKHHSSISWMDVNGDGLPDRITKHESGNRTVALNFGYHFGAEENWNFNDIQAGESDSKSAGLGVAFGNGSVNVGVGVSQSNNFSTYALMDVNGDGLPDQTIHPNESGTTKVRINSGNGFMPEMEWTGATHINENSSTSESANAAFTIGIPIPPPPLPTVVTLYINPSGSVGHGLNRELSKFADMNGDGFADFVKSKADNDLTVYESTIGRTNLLKEVKRPLGASFTMDYERIGNTYEMPNSIWALNSVKVFDGFNGDGADTLLTTFAYDSGFHHRHEREFYGFRKVITNTRDTENDNAVYTTVTQIFRNDNYYEKGLLLREVMTDDAGNKFVEKENVYELKDISTGAALPQAFETTNFEGSAFPALTETSQKFYEGQPEAGKSTHMTYSYDSKGNVTGYTDFGDEDAEDNISSSITYHNLADKYIIGTPKLIVVSGGSTNYRKRESVIDEITGDIIQIKQYLTDSEVAEHDMEYDEFGNLKKITRPKNANDQRLSFEYEYDDKVHTYTTKVSNSYGYSSEAAYDFRFGQMLNSKDLNGNEIVYELDDLGRVLNITGPYEKGGANHTIEFEYHPEAAVPWALTKHFDPSDPKNDLETAIFVDGLGRVLQTKKDAAIYAGEGTADTEVMTVSGRVKFDAFGRTISALYPVTEPLGTPGEFNETEDTITPTTTTYDVLNRTLTVTLPDGAMTSTEYDFASDRNGKKQFSTKTTDANGKQTEQFTDVRGRVTSVKNYTTDQPVWTSFKYNAINEQIEATDDLGHTTFSLYDNFGRRIERKHPDAGQTNYTYDMAGNLVQLETANLIKEGLAIEYTYDFERLTEITYPQNPENNVKYTYGEAGATDNRAGRIVLQEDATGAQEFFYGPLGEVVKNIRTIIIPQFGEQTYETQWTYDTWNRLTSMTYADGEVVGYTYNAGGLLRSMDGKKKSSTYSYVKQLGYDKFEQRVFLAYGNGTKTTYDYEPDRRRLKGMTAQTSAKRLFMDNVYEYDKVNNILSLKNNAPIPSANLMGGSSEYNYSYDDLYRLTSANGLFKGSNDEHTYTLAMSYNSVGGITQKVQTHLRKGQEQKKTTYNMAYTYGDEQPHAPVHIGEQTYTYDANGNQTGWASDVSGQRRNILWDEENRIRAVYDNGAFYHYTYDASGERVLKGQSTGQRIFVNGEWKAGSGQMGNYTVYVNPYLVLKSGGYTKHYYIEGQRIVSKLGGGIDNNGKGPLRAGEDKVDYAGRGQRVFDGIVKNLKFLGADGQILTAGKSGKVPPGQVNGTGNVTEAFRYFYHPDHLGSTSYITDASGEVYQHLEYFAFGETFIEEHSNTNRTPYLFNGKELDEETGLYYYGARYYEAQVSVWLSMDPMAEHPNQQDKSPYAYSWNNPVKLSDPDGKCPICPILVKAGAAGAIDMMTQVVINRFVNGNSWDQAFARVDWTQVGISALQGANPFSVPGGKWGRAAITALTDVGINAARAAANGEEYTMEQAGTDFLVGLIAQLGSEKVGEILGNSKALSKLLGKADDIAPSPSSQGSGGRLGNQTTRKQIDEIASELESRGYTITGGGGRTPEEYLKPLGGGRKGGSYPDITATKDGRTIRVNTVDTYKSGLPTKRELNNASRIRSQTPSDHLLLIPKSKD